MGGKRIKALLQLFTVALLVGPIRSLTSEALLSEAPDLNTSDFSEFNDVFALDCLDSLDDVGGTSEAIVALQAGAIAKQRQALEQANREYTSQDDMLIYLSEEGTADNLNAMGRSIDGKEILCRHLAFELVSRPEGIKNYHKDFGSIDAIEAIPALRDNKLDNNPELLTQFAEYQFIHLNRFGETIERLASALKEGETKLMFMNTGGHAMALSISNEKSPEHSKPTYLIKFYDPNRTSQHTEVLSEGSSALSKLKSRHLMPQSCVDKYFARSIVPLQIKTVFSTH